MIKGRSEQLSASNPEISAWVSANAGAGKTRVLVERVARLMLSGVLPERILCLTFTKAAAAEMSDRLHRTLGPWASMPDAELTAALSALGNAAPDPAILPQARRLFAQAIEAPGGLKIQTIHAFAQALLRRFPREAGLPPHFSVMDEREAQAVLAELRDTTLGEIGLNPVLAAHLDADGMDRLMAEIAARRGVIRRLIQRHGGIAGLIADLKRRLGLGDADHIAGIEAALVTPEIDLGRAIRALETSGVQDRARAALMREFLADRDGETYRRIFLTDEDRPRDPKFLASKAAKAADEPLLDMMLAEAGRIQALIEKRKSAMALQATQAVMEFADAMIRRHDAIKAAKARLDFDDLIDRGAHLLNEADAAAWVLYKLDGGIDHILVDEAQDTSPRQWTIVKALAQEFFAGRGAREIHRTVFAVGDEKQSIYSFQGADPEGFERGRRHFGSAVSAGGEIFREVELDWSYRSTHEILDSIDRIFSGPAGIGLTLDPSAIRHFAVRSEAGRVELWEPVKPPDVPPAKPWDAPFDQDVEASPQRLLARRIAEKISRWLSPEGERLPDGRKVKPGDILILVRRRNAFVETLIRALKAVHIPVSGADRMNLAEQIAVMDLLATARAVLLPEDDLNLAALLKSPLIGFDEDQLFALAHGRQGSLWQALCAGASTHEAEAHALIERWRRHSESPPYEFFARILNSGGRKQLNARLGLEANDPINELLASALTFEGDENPTLQGFVHWIDRTQTEIKRDLDANLDLVRIMTVHGAKGLEAPIVILPDTCAGLSGRNDPHLVALGDPDEDGTPEALLYVPRRALEDRHAAAARAALHGKQDAEYRRLLYVALTRAKDWLYIAGYEGRRGRPESCWYDLIAPAIQNLGRQESDETGVPVWRYERVMESSHPSRTDDPPQTAPSLPGWALTPAPAEIMARRLTPSHLPGADQALRRPGRFRRGRLIHRLLETLPDLPQSRRREAARRWLSRRRELTEADIEALVDETLGVIEHPEFAPLFGPSIRAEVGIFAEIAQGSVLVGRVDRLVVLPETVIVADYKTNRPPPKHPDEVAPLYMRQMAAYRAVLRQIHPDREIRAVLVWTDGPALMELDSSNLDRILVKTGTP